MVQCLDGSWLPVTDGSESKEGNSQYLTVGRALEKKDVGSRKEEVKSDQEEKMIVLTKWMQDIPRYVQISMLSETIKESFEFF